MALEFVDGMDQFDALEDFERKWTNRDGGKWLPNGGRFGGGAFRLNIGSASGEYLRKTEAPDDGFIFGFAFKYTLGADSLDAGLDIAQMGRTNTSHVTLRVNEDGTLEVFPGPHLSVDSLNEDEWYVIELKADAANNLIELHVNEETWISESAASIGAASLNWCRLKGENNQTNIPNNTSGFYDDAWIVSLTGGVHTDFRGDRRINTLKTLADTTRDDFTPLSGGDNYLEVDEVALDEDQSYNFSPTVGDRDMFRFEDIADTPETVDAVVVTAAAKKSEAGTRGLKEVLDDQGGAGPTLKQEDLLTTDYLYYQGIYEVKPSGGAWTKADISGAEAGYEVSS